jgi:hypothetical protein
MSTQNYEAGVEPFANPSDPYSATPEVDPDTPKSPAEKTLAEKTEEETKEELRIDGEAYNDLTKPDPNWATTFYHTDVRGDRWKADYVKLDKEAHFKMLGEIHRGEKNGPKYEHSELTTHNLREDLVEIIGKQLNLNELQLEEAKARATNVDGERFGMNLELLVYCVCAYVVHNDDSEPYAIERKVHPNCKSKDMIFEQVAFELGLRPDRINRVYRRFEQAFSDSVPPRGFDPRKPGWEPRRPDEIPDRGGIYTPHPHGRVGTVVEYPADSHGEISFELFAP